MIVLLETIADEREHFGWRTRGAEDAGRGCSLLLEAKLPTLYRSVEISPKSGFFGSVAIDHRSTFVANSTDFSPGAGSWTRRAHWARRALHVWLFLRRGVRVVCGGLGVFGAK